MIDWTVDPGQRLRVACCRFRVTGLKSGLIKQNIKNMGATSYRDLDIYKISFHLFVETHKFSLKLPQHELFELGIQLRRSSDSINSDIVEGYGRKRCKNDFIKFLTISHSSNDETLNHLEKLKILYLQFETTISELLKEYHLLGGKIHNFVEYATSNWRS